MSVIAEAGTSSIAARLNKTQDIELTQLIRDSIAVPPFPHIEGSEEIALSLRDESVQDGGLRAWLQVIGSFLIYCNLFGMVFAFGTFQSYYELSYLPSSSPSDISWIGTVAAFLLVTGGAVSGPFFDKGYFKTMLFAGIALEVIGTLLLSFSTTYWQIFLTQGIMAGCGSALLYVPGLALVGRSFKKHINVAMALVTAGAPVGGIVFSIIFGSLVEKVGFGWSIRAIALFILVTSLIALPLLLWKVHNVGHLNSQRKSKFFDPSALKDMPFWSFTTSSFLIDLGYWVPFTYLATYGQTQLGMTQTRALQIVIITQATSIAGRLIAGIAATKTGVMIPWLVCAIGSGICCLTWRAVTTSSSLIVIAAMYGMVSGALVPLPAAVFVVVCPDLEVYGVRYGMAQAVIGVASLIGSPIAGALTGLKAFSTDKAYLGLQIFSGLVMLAGAANLVQLWTSLIRHRALEKKLI